MGVVYIKNEDNVKAARSALRAMASVAYAWGTLANDARPTLSDWAEAARQASVEELDAVLAGIAISTALHTTVKHAVDAELRKRGDDGEF